LRRSLEPGQYTSIRYTERLEEAKAVRSVGSKGDSYDNAAAESLNSLYKRELIDFEKGWEGVGDVMMATMEAEGTAAQPANPRRSRPPGRYPGQPGERAGGGWRRAAAASAGGMA
jgi:transposase InsO family protein